MEQRPLRLGDIVDDYCPQERRLTNHVVVVLVEDVIRKTRCTTCDAEHPYKSGLLPRRRKKEDGDEAEADLIGQLVKPASASSPDGTPMVASNGSGPAGPSSTRDDVNGNRDDGHGNGDRGNGNESAPDGNQHPDGTWFGHRPLIRAQLPRSEGDPTTPRPIPEFTIYQRSRGGFRSHGPRDANGNGRPERDGNIAGAGDHNFNAAPPSFGRGGRGPGPGRPSSPPPFGGGAGDQPRHSRRRRRRHGKKP